MKKIELFFSILASLCNIMIKSQFFFLEKECHTKKYINTSRYKKKVGKISNYLKNVECSWVAASYFATML